MRVLICGARGQLGQELAWQLEEAGIVTVATARDTLDLGDPAAVHAFVNNGGFSHVFNCAAYTNVAKAEDDVEAAHALNHRAVADLAEACHGSGACLVHFSTDFVFDGARETPYGETDTTNPLNVYGASKRAGELALFERFGAELESGPGAYLVRTSWVFSAHGHNFVRTMADLMHVRERIEVVNDQWGRPTYAADLAAATLQMVGLGPAKALANGVFHVANSGITTWWGLAQYVRQELKRRGVCLTCPTAEDIVAVDSASYASAVRRPARAVLNTDKWARCAGHDLRPWQQGVADAIGKMVGRPPLGE